MVVKTCDIEPSSPFTRALHNLYMIPLEGVLTISPIFFLFSSLQRCESCYDCAPTHAQSRNALHRRPTAYCARKSKLEDAVVGFITLTFGFCQTVLFPCYTIPYSNIPYYHIPCHNTSCYTRSQKPSRSSLDTAPWTTRRCQDVLCRLSLSGTRAGIPWCETQKASLEGRGIRNK